ncbi:MAG TPA: PH domain-containing protein [Mycobacteriales bacterium]|nr:PH domain-containing protein [Mycobacteriales bacterium]
MTEPAAPEPAATEQAGPGPARPGPAGSGLATEPAPPWRRLNPRMLVIHPVQEAIRAMPALVGLLIAGSSSGNGPGWSLLGLGVVVVLGVVRWFTTTFRVTPEQVQVRHGLLRRRLLAVPRDRVRTVDVTANAMHRLLGLARVTVGTGRPDADADLRLDALSAAEVATLRAELLYRGTPGQPAVADQPAAPPDQELAHWRLSWVRYGPFTLSGLVAVGILGGFLAQTLSEAHLDTSRFAALRAVREWAERTPTLLVVLAVAGTLVVATTVASTVGYLLAFWRFRLTRQAHGTLHVTRGLVTTRATTIEERRLYGVELVEPLLPRAARAARCLAIATGLRSRGGERAGERGGALLLPPAPREEARRVAAEVLRTAEPVTVTLVSHGTRARRRRYTRALLGCAALVLATGLAGWLLGWPGWVWAATLASFGGGALLAEDRYRNLGHALTAGTLVAATGSVVRRRAMLGTDGIIGWNVRQSYFQRRAGLATLTATTAAGGQHYDVPDVDLGTAVRLADAALPGLLAPFLAGTTAVPPGPPKPTGRAAPDPQGLDPQGSVTST